MGEVWGCWSSVPILQTSKPSVREVGRLAKLFPVEVTTWDLTPGPPLGLFSAGPTGTGFFWSLPLELSLTPTPSTPASKPHSLAHPVPPDLGLAFPCWGSPRTPPWAEEANWTQVWVLSILWVAAPPVSVTYLYNSGVRVGYTLTQRGSKPTTWG